MCFMEREKKECFDLKAVGGIKEGIYLFKMFLC